jgi:hypothetical protein
MSPRLYPFDFCLVETGSTNKTPKHLNSELNGKLSFRFYIVRKTGVRTGRLHFLVHEGAHYDEQVH